MTSAYFLSTLLLSAGVMAATPAATEERTAQPALPAPPVAVTVRSAEPVLDEMQALERRVRMDTILFMPVAAPTPVLAVTSWRK